MSEGEETPAAPGNNQALKPCAQWRCVNCKLVQTADCEPLRCPECHCREFAQVADTPIPTSSEEERAKALRAALLLHTDNIPGPDQIDWCDVVHEYHAASQAPAPTSSEEVVERVARAIWREDYVLDPKGDMAAMGAITEPRDEAELANWPIDREQYERQARAAIAASQAPETIACKHEWAIPRFGAEDERECRKCGITAEEVTRAETIERLREALFAIADGEGEAQVIARQTLEQCGLPVPAEDGGPLCEDEGCPHHGTPHICINRAALSSIPVEKKDDGR